MTLCATIPASADGHARSQLFSRLDDTMTPWSASRYLPGQESAQARFADQYSESAPEAGARQVCQAFAHWVGRARAPRAHASCATLSSATYA